MFGQTGLVSGTLFEVGAVQGAILKSAEDAGINLRRVGTSKIGISLDERARRGRGADGGVSGGAVAAAGRRLSPVSVQPSLRGFGKDKSARACLHPGRRDKRASQADARGLPADCETRPPSVSALARSNRRTGARQCLAFAGSGRPRSIGSPGCRMSPANLRR